jgi:Ser/Thr protein kinase RdoA (MazF antagonist)
MKDKAEKAVEKETGNKPSTIEKEAEGLKHETYTARVDSKDYIVQFSGDDYENHDSLKHCLKMYELFSDSEVPVPEAVTEGPQELDSQKYIIVEKIPGENMEQSVSQEKVRQAGRLLAKIHNYRSFEHEGHIEFTQNGMEVHHFDEGSQKEKHRAEREEKLEIFRENGLEELADQLEEYLTENIDKAYTQEFEAVLCHDDYSPDNTIWNQGKITGIIDFDYAYSGIPERNLIKAANTFWMHDPGANWDIRQAFYDAYQEEREVADNFDEIEKYFRVETLSWLVAGLIDMGEVNEEQKEFYNLKIKNMTA